MQIRDSISTDTLSSKLTRVFDLAGKKIDRLNRRWRSADGSPVFTVEGKYTTRGWTDWTQGFQFGSAILVFDATGDAQFLSLGRENTIKHMAGHVTHHGVHDHGFNNVSTYGNLLRLMNEGKIPENDQERNFYELALKVSGAVQATRWTSLPGGLGYVYSFNGPHSLFSDTIRSMRALGLAHALGHALMGEKDRKIDLLDRAIRHAETTARFNVYFGTGRDSYDVAGRVVHESIFNLNDGSYRNPSTQQGYSPFTTWTRGHAWILLGFAEQLEFIDSVSENALGDAAKDLFSDKEALLSRFREVARVTADFYISEMPLDGIPYWDTGAPGLVHLGDYKSVPADPFNDYEPVDSSAAAIAAQGLIRLGHWMTGQGEREGERYLRAGLTVADRLFEEPYLSTDEEHEGLLLHSVYHRPNGWDFIPPDKKVPCGESSMWGDYHALELALCIKRLADGETYYRFFNSTGV